MDVCEKKAIQDKDFTQKYANNREHSGRKQGSRPCPKSQLQRSKHQHVLVESILK